MIEEFEFHAVCHKKMGAVYLISSSSNTRYLKLKPALPASVVLKTVANGLNAAFCCQYVRWCIHCS